VEYNIIYKNNEAFQILNDINVHMFQNKDGSINQQVLGMYVYKFNGNKVLQRGDKFLICRKIEEAIIL
jgi:hypothetical protein